MTLAAAKSSSLGHTSSVCPSEEDFADASNLELYFTHALGYVLSSQENV